MFQPLKPINFKPISSGFFIFFRFMSGVGCVGCFFSRAFLGCLPAKRCTSHKSVAYLLVFQRECLFARRWPVSLCIFAYLIPIHKCPLIILNIATFIVCSSIWSLKKIVVTAQSIPCVPIPHAHWSFFLSVFWNLKKPHCTDIALRFSGRAIRHRGDYATILLLDKRYGSAKIKKSLPGWISDRLQHHARFGSAFAAIRKVNLL